MRVTNSALLQLRPTAVPTKYFFKVRHAAAVVARHAPTPAASRLSRRGSGPSVTFTPLHFLFAKYH